MKGLHAVAESVGRSRERTWFCINLWARKGRGTRDQIANIHWIMKKAREFQKIIYFCYAAKAAEKAMAPHSSTLAWKIPWAEKPGRVQSMGSLRVGHD